MPHVFSVIDMDMVIIKGVTSYKNFMSFCSLIVCVYDYHLLTLNINYSVWLSITQSYYQLLSLIINYSDWLSITQSDY